MSNNLLGIRTSFQKFTVCSLCGCVYLLLPVTGVLERSHIQTVLQQRYFLKTGSSQLKVLFRFGINRCLQDTSSKIAEKLRGRSRTVTEYLVLKGWKRIQCHRIRQFRILTQAAVQDTAKNKRESGIGYSQKSRLVLMSTHSDAQRVVRTSVLQTVGGKPVLDTPLSNCIVNLEQIYMTLKINNLQLNSQKPV